jgi:hypothetical protein
MKLRIPLRRRTVEGVTCPVPLLRLRVPDRYGTFATVDFRVDTQADLPTIPVSTAQAEGIPFSRARERVAAGLVGQASVFRDRLQVVIAGREHDWLCDFIQVPAAAPGQPTRELLPVLGRAGFLSEYAIGIDGDFLTVTRVGPIRRWVRERLHTLWKVAGLVHPADRPLQLSGSSGSDSSGRSCTRNDQRQAQ